MYKRSLVEAPRRNRRAGRQWGGAGAQQVLRSGDTCSPQTETKELVPKPLSWSQSAQAPQSPEHREAKRLQWSNGYSLWNGRSWLRRWKGTMAQYRGPRVSGQNTHSVSYSTYKKGTCIPSCLHSFIHSLMSVFIHSFTRAFSTGLRIPQEQEPCPSHH